MNKNSELSIDCRCKGKWNIEIINPDRPDASHFPFGREFKDNVLTQTFFDIFGAQLPSVGLAHRTNSRSYSLLLSRAVAVLGSGTSTPDISNYQLDNKIKSSSYSRPNENLGGTFDDVVTGTRTLKRSWDFTVNTSATETFTEAGLESIVKLYRTGLGFTRTEVFSRFVFPSAVEVPRGSYVRLYYSLAITIPALVSPIIISPLSYEVIDPDTLETTTLDLSGELALCADYNGGLGWDKIFGRVNDDGLIPYNSNPYYDGGNESSDGGRHCPFFPPQNYVNNTYTSYNGSPSATQIVPNIPLSPTSTLLGNVAGNIVGVSIYNNSGYRGIVNFLQDSGTSNSCVCKYFFYPNNPILSCNFGGIMFGDSNTLVGGNPAYWHWKFYTTQARTTNYYIMFSVRHTVSSA